MSEREYFSFKYTIPGFTFLLIVASINYIPLLFLSAKTPVTFGVLLAFLSILTGSAFGFLLSQIWWVLFLMLNTNFGLLKKRRKPIETLYNRFPLKEPFCWLDIKAKRKVVMLYDYILHSSIDEKEKSLYDYRKRRWDMYHVLSSETLTIALAVATGLLLRIFSFSEIPLRGLNPALLALETTILLVTLTVSALLFIVSLIEAILVWDRYNAIADVMIRKCLDKEKYNKDKLSLLFPELFKTD